MLRNPDNGFYLADIADGRWRWCINGQIGLPGRWQDRNRSPRLSHHALSRERSTTSPISQGAIPSEELERVRPSFAGAWQPDGMGHARSDRRVAGAAHGPARPVPFYSNLAIETG